MAYASKDAALQGGLHDTEVGVLISRRLQDGRRRNYLGNLQYVFKDIFLML